MKLAIITETFPPDINGVAMTFGVICRELARRGHSLTVYRPAQTHSATPTQPEGYTEVPMPGFPIPGYPMLKLGWPARRHFQALWRAERPDLVHVVTEGPLGASAITAARRIGIPVTSSFHTNFHSYTGHYGVPLLHRLTLWWLRRIHNRTLKTFAPTLELGRELELLGFRNLALLSRGVDTRQFSPALRSRELRQKWGAGPEDLVVLHVGRLAAEKNYPQLFRCYDAMRAARPGLRFVIVGDGPLREQLQDAHPECHLTGFVTRDTLATYYASADLYIHASLSETFGNVLTEAMSSGLAVAGFDYAAARQFIRHGENGLVAPSTRPDLLEHAAASLAQDDRLRTLIRKGACEAVAGQSWEKVIARFEADLLALTRPQPPRAP